MRRIVSRQWRDRTFNAAEHNGFWISGSAVTGPPYTDYWTPAGAVLLQRSNGSVVELVRFNLESLELDDQGVAALFGLEAGAAGGRYILFLN